MNDIIPMQYTPKWVVKNDYAIQLDQYYTKSNVAQECINYFNAVSKRLDINLQEYTFIEPSAGNGMFYDLLPNNKIGMDLESSHPSIKKLNFFNFHFERNRKYVAIGNPPFGARAWMALSFITRCALHCDLVGFILPMYFASEGKGSAKSRVKKMGLDLVLSKELPPDIFYTPQKKELAINTVFQVWAKKGIAKGEQSDTLPIEKLKEYVDVYTVCTAPKRRCGLNRMSEYDCFLQSTYYSVPKIQKNFENVKYGSGYGIIIKRETKTILKLLMDIDWDKYSLRATNHCKHLGMSSIFRGLYDKGVLNI